MPGAILTTLSTAQCPHGGAIKLTPTTNAVANISGGFVLLETDLHTVSGCPFTIPGTPPVPSPCLTVKWSGGSTLIKVNQVGVLTKSSIGQCIGPTGVQGNAIIGNTQTDASTTA